MFILVLHTVVLLHQVADVLMVNIWCHDIGREQGSGKPLLKTIFQVGLTTPIGR
jgi:hypothetical protein